MFRATVRGRATLLRGKPWRSVMAEDRSAISIVRESKILAYTVGVATLAAGLVLFAVIGN